MVEEKKKLLTKMVYPVPYDNGYNINKNANTNTKISHKKPYPKPPKAQDWDRKNEIISKMLQIEEMRTISISKKPSRDSGVLGMFYQNTLSG